MHKYHNISNMLIAASVHANKCKNEIVPLDDVMSFSIGFSCLKCGEHWCLDYAHVRMCNGLRPELGITREFVQNYLLYEVGRRQLARCIPRLVQNNKELKFQLLLS